MLHTKIPHSLLEAWVGSVQWFMLQGEMSTDFIYALQEPLEKIFEHASVQRKHLPSDLSV